jgi:anti-sigma-K factor RskA
VVVWRGLREIERKSQTMNLSKYPQTLDRLAANYALGTLRGGARRRFEAISRESATVRAAALVWKGRLSGMTELQSPILPSPAVWTRIQNMVQAERDALAMQLARQQGRAGQTKDDSAQSWLGSIWQGLWVWRGAAAAGALATVLAVVTGFNLRDQLDIRGKQVDELSAQLKVAPKIEYVAVLVDAKSAETMLVTFDSKSQNLVLQRVGDYQEANDKSLQLWALPNSGGPRSLGVLGGDKVLRLATAEGDVKQVPTLAISLEPKGGVPSAGGPTGPVLFKGALIQKVI